MIQQYYRQLSQVLEEVFTTQEAPMKEAAAAVAKALKQNGTVFTFGTGHSHMLAEELFYRAGGLVKIYPIFDEALMLHVSASGSSLEERKEGLAQKLLHDGLPIQKDDVLFLFSNSGRNSAPLDLALLAEEKGMHTVCITNGKHSRSVTSRHSSGKRLFELCRTVIDNGGCVGDAAITVGKHRCGPTSTAVGAAILQAIVCQAVEQMQQEGFEPEVFSSSNVDGGDQINAAYLEKYRPIIPML